MAPWVNICARRGGNWPDVKPLKCAGLRWQLGHSQMPRVDGHGNGVDEIWQRRRRRRWLTSFNTVRACVCLCVCVCVCVCVWSSCHVVAVSHMHPPMTPGGTTQPHRAPSALFSPTLMPLISFYQALFHFLFPSFARLPALTLSPPTSNFIWSLFNSSSLRHSFRSNSNSIPFQLIISALLPDLPIIRRSGSASRSIRRIIRAFLSL